MSDINPKHSAKVIPLVTHVQLMSSLSAFNGSLFITVLLISQQPWNMFWFSFLGLVLGSAAGSMLSRHWYYINDKEVLIIFKNSRGILVPVFHKNFVKLLLSSLYGAVPSALAALCGLLPWIGFSMVSLLKAFGIVMGLTIAISFIFSAFPIISHQQGEN